MLDIMGFLDNYGEIMSEKKTNLIKSKIPYVMECMSKKIEKTFFWTT